MVNKRWFYALGFFTFLLIMGAYVIPFIPQFVVPLYEGDAVANQISYINYLLTLIATLATMGGIIFSVYSFYQSSRVPNMVKEEVNRSIQQHKEELDEKLLKSLKAMMILSEHSILGQELYPISLESKLERIETAEKEIPELWGMKYYKALIYWYSPHAKQSENRQKTLSLLSDHCVKNPDHVDAWIEIIDWYHQREDHVRALTNLETLLRRYPHAYKMAETRLQHELNTDLRKWRTSVIEKAKLKEMKKEGANRQILERFTIEELKEYIKEKAATEESCPSSRTAHCGRN
ncbi:hypothetical protein [Laceyella putida]|uniref:Uncharacterized protein n=1 Tax=Laceyella putida TaxID=110101 RepID=A0ABW2RHD9_9BACL